MLSRWLTLITITALVGIILWLPEKAQAKNIEPGIFLPGAENNISVLTNLENNLGIKFRAVKFYLDWSDDFSPEIAKRLKDHGAIPEVTWQPQIGSTGVANADVIEGRYDRYINRFARDVKSLGFTIRIALAPEMNGSWAPWGVGNSGNNAINHRQFWRYTVEKFRNAGVNNVKWVWSPNVHFWGEKYAYAEMYPGNSYVDYFGLDGYNWGTSQSWSVWQTFSQVFASSYQDLAALSSKPIYITEVASTELGGSKAAWITKMFSDLQERFPQILGLTWFNINKETDWRIESSQSSRKAFINGLASQHGSVRMLGDEGVPVTSKKVDEERIRNLTIPRSGTVKKDTLFPLTMMPNNFISSPRPSEIQQSSQGNFSPFLIKIISVLFIEALIGLFLWSIFRALKISLKT